MKEEAIGILQYMYCSNNKTKERVPHLASHIVHATRPQPPARDILLSAVQPLILILVLEIYILSSNNGSSTNSMQSCRRLGA